MSQGWWCDPPKQTSLAPVKIVCPVKYLKSCLVFALFRLFPFYYITPWADFDLFAYLSPNTYRSALHHLQSLSLSLYFHCFLCGTTLLWMHWLWLSHRVFKLLLFKTLMRTWSVWRHSMGFVPIVWLRDSKTSLLHRRLTCCCENGMKIQNVSVFWCLCTMKPPAVGEHQESRTKEREGQFTSSRRTVAEVYMWGLLNILWGSYCVFVS